MIEFLSYSIRSLSDYELVYNKIKTIFPHANHSVLVQELKERIGISCRQVLVEYPYRDYDFSSVYGLFYAKKHQPVSRECIRLHFFSDETVTQDSYLGYLVVRDSCVDSRGKAVVVPKLLSTSAHTHLVTSPITAHVFGISLRIETVPWMAQDTDISVCAHIAVWSIVNYFAFKYPHYKRSTIGQIAENTPQYLGRKTPSEGLNLLQISELLSINGFYPLVFRKRSEDDKDFFRAVYAYIESGVPMVIAMTKKEHAVTLVGHGSINISAIQESSEDMIYTADYVEEYVISDDNMLPFTSIRRSDTSYTFRDMDYAIVPLYEKMYLNANIVYKRIEGVIEANVLHLPKPCVVRIYLTSVRSLKRHAYENDTMDNTLKHLLLTLHMPQFVWCADICSKEAYARRLTSARIIIDSTAGTYENDPWLLMHDATRIIYRDGEENRQVEQTIAPYSMYINNLQEV